VWTADGERLVFLVSSEGSAHLHTAGRGGGETAPITSGPRDFSAPHASRDGSHVAMVGTDPTTPPEVFTMEIAPEGTAGEPVRRSFLNRDWCKARVVAEPEEFRVPSDEGHAIHGWLLRPPGADPGKKLPLALEVHGGPHAQYGWAFFHELQVLAASGYVVAYANPRGSQGYGRDFGAAILKDWGNRDFKDLMDVVDHVSALEGVDETRVGILGGSYGGFMTNWALGHSDRFRCGVTQRSVVSMTSMFGSSDYGTWLHDELGASPWEDPELYRRLSPLASVDRIEAPLLIIHSENDHRCPIAEGEQLYTALKWRRKTVEMVRFRGESHGLSRGGRPLNRIERLERIVGWLERYL